jgi:outer membrane immunogenic protein
MRSLLMSSLVLPLASSAMLVAGCAIPLAGAALAADLPSTKAPPSYIAPTPVFSWTGFYLGVEGGADFIQTGGYGFRSSQTSGLLGGVVGYNYQVNQFVLGLEGDGGGVLGSRTIVSNAAAVNSFGSAAASNSYFADIRGRVGYVWDRALPYVAGGVAFGDNRTFYANSLVAPPIAFNNSRAGYTIGAGVDYAFTDNWIGRIEYRYTDFGRSSDFAIPDRVRASSNAVLVGVMYKFGAP